jgi:hypothetical protein
MDTSGFVIYPFCCAGFLVSAFSAQAIGTLLFKGQSLARLDGFQKAFIKMIIFIIGLAFTWFVISYVFRDLYVM